MLSSAEKAYCRALLALKRKEYGAAADLFDDAAAHFKNDREFNLLMETTGLLLAVKKERARIEADNGPELKEMLRNGEKAIVRGQGQEGPGERGSGNIGIRAVGEGLQGA